MSARLTIGLLRGSMVAYLPGPANTERVIFLSTGREAELLWTMLRAIEAGEKGIETRAEPTQSLAFHLQHHKRFPSDSCAHCIAEAEDREARKVKRYGPRGGLLSTKRKPKKDDFIRAMLSLPPAERRALIEELMQGTQQ